MLMVTGWVTDDDEGGVKWRSGVCGSGWFAIPFREFPMLTLVMACCNSAMAAALSSVPSLRTGTRDARGVT